MQGVFLLAVELLASQEGVDCMESVIMGLIEVNICQEDCSVN